MIDNKDIPEKIAFCYWCGKQVLIRTYLMCSISYGCEECIGKKKKDVEDSRK